MTNLKYSWISLLVIQIFLMACGEKKNNVEETTQIKQYFTPVVIAKPINKNVDEYEYVKLTSTGTPIISKVSGQLEKGEIPLELGAKFKKNDLLFQINNKEAFKQLMQDKKELSNALKELYSEINLENRDDYAAIQKYNDEIFKNVLLQKLPLLSLNNQLLLKKKFIYKRVNKIKVLEQNMENYFILAPSNGQILRLYTTLNEPVKRNEKVLEIGKNKSYVLNLPISTNNNTIDVYNFDGKKIGLAKKKKLNSYVFIPNQQFTTEDLIVKIKYNTREEKDAYWIPKSALNYGEISILKSNHIKHLKVSILEKKEGGYIINGPSENDLILVNFK